MRKTKFWAVTLAVSLVLALTWSCAGKKPPLVDTETLKGWLSDSQVLILDVRAAKDWQVSHQKIKGAVRRDPDEVETWATSLPRHKKIVLY